MKFNKQAARQVASQAKSNRSPNAWQLGRTLAAALDYIDQLEAEVECRDKQAKAMSAVIDWYEDDYGTYNYEREDLPSDFAEVYDELKATTRALTKLLGHDIPEALEDSE